MTVTFGMIGCGNIARSIGDVFKETENNALIGCSSTGADDAYKFAQEYGIDNWHTDHVAMLNEVDPDVAIIATPNGAHAKIVVDAASAGVNVLCQKPLEIRVDALNRMAEACKKNRVRFGALIDSRFGFGAQAAKHVVEEGYLGDLLLVNGICPVWRSDEYFEGWHGTANLDGGVLFSQAIHLVDRLAWLNNGIERVYADLGMTVHDIEVEDLATVQVRYRNGARGTITASTATKNYPHYDRVDIHGQEGYLTAAAREVLSFNATDRDELNFETPYEHSGFAVQVEDMARAVQENREPIVTGYEARHACDAVAAMHASSIRGEPVVVSEFVNEDRGGVTDVTR